MMTNEIFNLATNYNPLLTLTLSAYYFLLPAGGRIATLPGGEITKNLIFIEGG